MKRLIWLPIAGFLLIAGAAVAAAAPTVVESAKGLLTVASPDPSSGATITVNDDEHAWKIGPDGLLTQVLADLVANGTLTQAQSDAVTTGLQDAIEARRTDMQARMELISGFVEDGVITQDEINQLPADDPLRVAFDSIANDGQISLEQLRGLGPGFGPGFGPGHHGRGPGGSWFVDPSSSSSNS
jgi:hypothetical protein